MTTVCASCGKPFPAKRRDAKYCGGTCRERASALRKSATKVTSLPVGLVEATRAELERAGKLDTVLGQSALRLAERMSGSYDTGSAIASLSRELRAVMAELMADVPAVADSLDELAARRRGRAASA